MNMSKSRIWKPYCNSKQNTQAVNIAQRLAYSVFDYANRDADSSLWTSLENSFLAILFAHLDPVLPQRDYDDLAHRTLSECVRKNLVLDSASMLGGLSQIGIAAVFMAERYGGYTKLLTNIDSTITEEAEKYAAQLELSISADDVSVDDYDFVSGIAGITAYLLVRSEGGAHVRQSLHRCLKALTTLCDMDEGGAIRFSVRRENATVYLGDDWGPRVVNCGLAHGVPGIAAVLSLAVLHGETSAHIQRSLRLLIDWLISNAVYDEWGAVWPTGVSVPRSEDDLDRAAEYWALAWCYGSVGVARSIHLAGQALGDLSYLRFARDTIKASVLGRLKRYEHYQEYSICHGLAGILLILLRFYHDEADEEVSIAIDSVLERLIVSFDDNLRFGFRITEQNGTETDDPSFMRGAVGIALSLLAAASDVEPTWDRALGIS